MPVVGVLIEEIIGLNGVPSQVKSIFGGDQSGRKTQLFKYHVTSVIHQRIMNFLTSYSTHIMLTIDQV